jgi:N-formylglutamate deformylase
MRAIETLLEIYYRPYHRALSDVPEGVLLGVDCHTMAAEGPPIGPDPGSKRPSICLGNREGTCPDEWLHSLADCLARASGERVSVNDPFKGGYIIRSHASELPWIQLELSREPFATNSQKRRFVLEALDDWCSQHGR